MNGPVSITVKYALIDGAHFFTGKNAYALGLCVAHKDLKTAFDEVAIQLVNLMDVNLKIKAKVEPSVSFEEFEKWVAASQVIETPKTKTKNKQTVSANLSFAAKAA